jgi:argininosuccinate lyase
MLARQKIIPQREATRIITALRQIRTELEHGTFRSSPADEDIHMAVERRLIEKIGAVGGKLHTARSRNDQVALDLRLYLRDETTRILELLQQLRRALTTVATTHADVIMPGYTHLQPAQPVLFAHHLLAYAEMVARDQQRFTDGLKRIDVMPLGSGALAGTTFPIDRQYVARRLGFHSVSTNSMDAVSDRDFAVEFLAACAILGMHLSRFAEDLILWSSQEFGFITLPDAFATGSSIMPQKRNPDAAELIRGKTGRVLGDFVSLATVVKGLVLTYGTDLQEDKERVFDAADTIEICLAAMAAMIADLTADTTKMRAAAEPGFPTATDLADWVVRALKKPFREAHHIAGSIVKRAEELGVTLDKLPLDEMQKIEPGITNDVFAVLSLEASVNSRMSLGGTAPARVKEQLRLWREKLK